jgi:hypothetical protein
MDHRPDGQGEAMKKALVVGGQHAFVKNKLTKSLERHGIEVASHWAWDRSKPPLSWPKDIDLIYICTDMVSHKVANPAVEHCRTSGIPYVNGTRKWAESIVRLTTAGFPLVNPTDSLAEILDENLKRLTPAEMKAGPTEVEMQAMLVALAGSVELAEDLVTKAAAANTDSLEPAPPMEPIMPASPATSAAAKTAPSHESKQRDTYYYARDHKNPLQAAYIREVLKNPEISNKQIETALIAKGLIKQLDPIRTTAARQFCGVTTEGSGVTAKRKIDEEKFIAAAAAVGSNDFNLPGTKSTPRPPPGAPEKTEMTAKKTVSAPAPITVETIPALDLKSLLVLLKERMKQENYTELHITENGVQFKRVQVTEGLLDV